MEDFTQALSSNGLAVALDVITNCFKARSEDEFRAVLASLDRVMPTENIAAVLAQAKGSGPMSSCGLKFLSVYPATGLEAWLRMLCCAEGEGGLDRLFGSDEFHVLPAAGVEDIARWEMLNDFVKAIECRDCIVSVRTTERLALKGILIFAGSGSLSADARYLTIVKLLAPHLHSALIRIGLDLFKPRDALSTREREVLRWIGAGKTSGEISRILQIAERTVIFHVQNAMKKLGATSRAQAIALASQYELLHTRSSTSEIGTDRWTHGLRRATSTYTATARR